MPDPKRVSPAEAKALLDHDYVYVDVRSVPEFEAEHPAGAFNVPLAHMTGGGMSPNPDFLSVMTAKFAKDAKIVVGCKAGGRSLKAAQTLLGAGFTNVIDQRAGFDGARDPFGGGLEAGWKGAGLPVANGDGGEKSWSALSKKG
jgi:rhodanese-related sulfurtransferase